MLKSVLEYQQSIQSPTPFWQFFLVICFVRMDEQNRQNNTCSMVGFLGIMIQLGLGILSFSVLIIKRLREKPRRPWKIWLFDTSKQLMSQMLAHFINLTISIGLASQDTSSDECLWYFITNILDNTLGVFICIAGLKGIETLLARRHKNQYISGNYYTKVTFKVEIEISNMPNQQEHNVANDASNPPKCELVEEREESTKDSRVTADESARKDLIDRYKIDYRCWLVQLLIWISIVVVGKSVIFGVEIGLQQQLKTLSFFLLGWIEAYPVLELMLVIVIVPVIMNGFAFWVQDNFLKKREQNVPAGENLLIQEMSERRGDAL